MGMEYYTNKQKYILCDKIIRSCDYIGINALSLYADLLLGILRDRLPYENRLAEHLEEIGFTKDIKLCIDEEPEEITTVAKGVLLETPNDL